MYKWIIRPILFLINPERIHYFIFRLLQFFSPILKRVKLFTVQDPRLQRQIFNLSFENPVGLAAGFDKDAKRVDELATFGFGFIEIGTLTPQPQPGNEKPRLFRLPKDSALINRMGFNNDGVWAAVERLKRKSSFVIVGGNIGKNKNTPNDKAIDDYVTCLHALAPYVDYFVVNVSSPNTPGLRELQDKKPLREILLKMKLLADALPQPKPVLLKIAPDLSADQLNDVIEVLKETKTDGVIATNTTIERENLITPKNEVEKIGSGGVSGKPLSKRSTEVIRYLRKQLGPDFPIIGVGGIMSVDDALEKIEAGANLIQIYTGFIYEGPGFVKRILKAMVRQ